MASAVEEFGRSWCGDSRRRRRTAAEGIPGMVGTVAFVRAAGSLAATGRVEGSSEGDGPDLPVGRRWDTIPRRISPLPCPERRLHMAYTLPPLPYAFDALEPSIDARTMEIHHDRHHKAYVDNVNKALEAHPDLAALPVEKLIADLEKVPEAIRTVVRNNGGGHANHTLFWESLGKGKGGEPAGHLGEAVRSVFSSFENFKTALSDAAMKRFGSGWAWLSLDPKGKVLVESTANQDSPIMHGNVPLFGIDVWEHAYYLKYQNKRADYVAAIYDVIDWDAVGKRFAAHKK
jgi:Fe-Mn family superoxide dismutase